MEITDIKIRRIITEGRLRAVVSITLDNMLAVHDIKIVQGDERLFVECRAGRMKMVSSEISSIRFLLLLERSWKQKSWKPTNSTWH